jgi:nicotinate-nucleotide adenylyltransferase
MKVGVFGGTFDPIHNGHLITAAAVKKIRGLDKIFFIPSYIAPHKIDKVSSSPDHRIEMIKLAIEGIPYFEYSDYEINKEGVSYTIDTLKFLKNKYPDIELIIGYDNLLDFKTWKEPDKILKLVKLVVLKREVENEPIEKDIYYHSSEIIETPIIDISSTLIRNRVRNNLSINLLVPDNVKEYIYRFNLYKD